MYFLSALEFLSQVPGPNYFSGVFSRSLPLTVAPETIKQLELLLRETHSFCFSSMVSRSLPPDLATDSVKPLEQCVIYRGWSRSLEYLALNASAACFLSEQSSCSHKQHVQAVSVASSFSAFLLVSQLTRSNRLSRLFSFHPRVPLANNSFKSLQQRVFYQTFHLLSQLTRSNRLSSVFCLSHRVALTSNQFKLLRLRDVCLHSNSSCK